MVSSMAVRMQFHVFATDILYIHYSVAGKNWYVLVIIDQQWDPIQGNTSSQDVKTMKVTRISYWVHETYPVASAPYLEHVGRFPLLQICPTLGVYLLIVRTVSATIYILRP